MLSSSRQIHELCPPFNLASLPNYPLLLADRVLDANCQLFVDTEGAHDDAYYGAQFTCNCCLKAPLAAIC